jgi:hypothetical protein
VSTQGDQHPTAANDAALAAADSIVAASEEAREGGVDRTDTTRVTLAPNAGAEVKLRMEADARARYVWTVRGGVVDYDLHGDSANASKDWYVSYKQGRGVPADSGELVAGFRGSHGWFWRNRGTAPVEVVLITNGAYSEAYRP